MDRYTSRALIALVSGLARSDHEKITEVAKLMRDGAAGDGTCRTLCLAFIAALAADAKKEVRGGVAVSR